MIGPAEWAPPVASGPPTVHPAETPITGRLPAPPPVIEPRAVPRPMRWSGRGGGLSLPKLGIEPTSLVERSAYQSSGSPDPMAGAAPEVAEIARSLAAARSRGVEVLSRRWVADLGESIDHLVVAPNGLWVIHAEPTPAGRVERRDSGDWFDSQPHLVIGDQDRTHTVNKVQSVVGAMQTWLSKGPYDGVPVIGVICFVDAPRGWFSQPFEVGGVNVMLRHQLIEPMLTAILLAPAAQDDLINHLAMSFRAAS